LNITAISDKKSFHLQQSSLTRRESKIIPGVMGCHMGPALFFGPPLFFALFLEPAKIM